MKQNDIRGDNDIQPSLTESPMTEKKELLETVSEHYQDF